MITRNNASSSSASQSLLSGWTEPPKHWIKFQELYPCILNDPIQVYIKHHLQLPCTTINTFNNGDDYDKRKDAFFQKYQSQLFFVDQRLQIPRFKSILKDITLHKSRKNYYSVPIFNERRKWKMMVDLLVTHTFLLQFTKDIIKNDDEDKLYIVFLTQSKNMTSYKEYQAQFASLLLSSYKDDIVLDKVFFLNLDTETLQSVTIDLNGHMTTDILKYCKWIRTCINFGHTLELYPPSHPNLYPNMKTTTNDICTDRWKADFAKELNEITLLWKCHPKHRTIAHKLGVYSFTDPNFDIDSLGIENPHDKFILSKMLHLYHHPETPMYLPEDFSFHINTRYTLYVDFETIDSIIYWIGIFIHDQETNSSSYTYFIADNIHPSSQEKIMCDFITFLETMSNHYTLFYWYAEKSFWSVALKSCKTSHVLQYDYSQWFDLCRFFIHTPIIVQGCFNFKLKTIAKEMKRLGLIEITCPESCQSGYESIDLAQQFFSTKDPHILSILESYNHFDCKVMFEMIQAISLFNS